MPFQFRLRTLFVIVAAVSLPLVALDVLQRAVWDGSFELMVRLNDPRVSSITRLDYGLYNREVAEFAKVRKVPRDFEPAVLVRREFVADVRCWGTESGLGWRKTYDHTRWIVIWAHYRDGTDHCQVVEIPYGRGARMLEVDFGPGQDAATSNESSSSEPTPGSKGT